MCKTRYLTDYRSFNSVVPDIIVGFPDILDSFFKALVSEDKNVKVSVQEALSMMTGAYKEQVQNKDIKDKLIKILYEAIILHPVRFIAAQYASKVFDSHDCDSRVILLVGSGDPKLEVKDECRIGLAFLEYTQESAQDYNKSLPDIEELSKKLIKLYGTPITWQTLNGIKYIGSFMIGSFGYV